MQRWNILRKGTSVSASVGGVGSSAVRLGLGSGSLDKGSGGM